MGQQTIFSSMRKLSRHSVPVIIVLVIFGVEVAFKHRELIIFNDRVHRQRSFLKTLNELSEKIPYSSIHNDIAFMYFSKVLKSMENPPFLILYDSSNVDVVLNHICNLKFIPNALSRLVAVAFDENALNVLQKKHPTVPNVLVNLEQYTRTIDSDMENRRYLIYSFALVTHAKICASLAARGIDFWSMHQDTIWIENFGTMHIEDRHKNSHLIFDKIGNEFPKYMRMQNWICGATFFVRASPLTHQFFTQVEHFMLTHQSPDSSVMFYLCGHKNYQCAFLPHSISSSFDYFESPRSFTPVLLQLDAPKMSETKYQMMKRGNFIFRNKNGTCSAKVFHKLRSSVKNAFLERQKFDGELRENWMQKTTYAIKEMFNIDPLNRKWFLTIHHSLI